jgi:hypothetical protein
LTFDITGSRFEYIVKTGQSVIQRGSTTTCLLVNMKTFVLIFLISLTLNHTNTFEYHEEYNIEDTDGRSLDDNYREIGEEFFNYYEPVITPIITSTNQDGHVPYNDIPNESSVKPSDTVHESAPEIELTTVGTKIDAKKDAKKPYYDEKDAPELFRKFIEDFNKQYKDEEEYNKRYQNFVKNLKDINKLNTEEDATFDINMFADLGEGESVIG